MSEQKRGRPAAKVSQHTVVCVKNDEPVLQFTFNGRTKKDHLPAIKKVFEENQDLRSKFIANEPDIIVFGITGTYKFNDVFPEKKEKSVDQ